MMGLPVNTVKTQLHRARAVLAKALGAGFEERVMQRIATVAATAPQENLKAQFEYRRALLRRRLLREAWMSSVTIMGIGACAFALVWRYAPDIQRLAAGPTPVNDPSLMIGATIAFLGGAIWFVLRRVRG